MNNLALQCLLFPIAVGIGVFLLYVFIQIYSNIVRGKTSDDLESYITTERMIRNGELISILYQIGKPDMKDGSYSEEKMLLWDYYKRKNKEDEELTNIEIQYILDAGY